MVTRINVCSLAWMFTEVAHDWRAKLDRKFGGLFCALRLFNIILSLGTGCMGPVSLLNPILTLPWALHSLNCQTPILAAATSHPVRFTSLMNKVGISFSPLSL